MLWSWGQLSRSPMSSQSSHPICHISLCWRTSTKSLGSVPSEPSHSVAGAVRCLPVRAMIWSMQKTYVSLCARGKEIWCLQLVWCLQQQRHLLLSSSHHLTVPYALEPGSVSCGCRAKGLRLASACTLSQLAPCRVHCLGKKHSFLHAGGEPGQEYHKVPTSQSTPMVTPQ